MKIIIKVLLSLLLVSAASCSPKITSNMINTQPKLSIEEKVALLDTHHVLPQNTIKIGELKFQDSGFSTDCSFNSLLNSARTTARENGANVVKVVEKKAPNFWSTCYRLKIELHKYEGDVTGLPQYQLTLD